MRPIDLMIVGAQKAGTTSLLMYLGEHPNIVRHAQKEFAYFLTPNEYKKGYESAVKKYYQTESISDSDIILAKSASLYSDEEALKRLYAHNPKCEIVIILRNPVDRAYSSYLMEKNAGSGSFGFDEIPRLLSHKSSWEYQFFIDYGIYIQHLRILYSIFPKEQVQVIFYEDLKDNAPQICKTIFQKIGVRSDFMPNTKIKHNVTQKQRSVTYAKMVAKALSNKSILRKLLLPFTTIHQAHKYGNAVRGLNKSKEFHQPMSTGSRMILSEFFKPYNEELSRLLGKDLSNWNYSNEKQER